MLTRRGFLYTGAASLALPTWIKADALADFDAYRQQVDDQFNTHVQQERERFANYANTVRDAFAKRQQEVRGLWGDEQIGDKTTLVDYSDDLQTRTIIDYEKRSIRVETLVRDNSDTPRARLAQALVIASTSDIEDFTQRDPVAAIPGDNSTPRSRSSRNLAAGALLAPETPNDQDAVIQTLTQKVRSTSVQTQTAANGQTIAVVEFEVDNPPKRGKEFLPYVMKYAREEQIEPALALAIMENESAFNPMAKSHIPAFGLMQIVPTSAGRDTTKKLYGEERLLSAANLYNPEENIRHGCAYLNILQYRYLRQIDDPVSQRYCVISAYNTGAGNVARAFTGSTSPAQAASVINRMPSDQVYNRLLANLPYEETQNYLRKVNKSYLKYS
ncbi:DUF3393 domain-containing protein [Maribrevibacterium harenarium]|uniref:DUF3393 domain-containing protein n=1 Tax=Maribrevibacterium harenarium TaxID=2589817 RepID=A0A501WIU7_9GAMM|nr:murein transglycosylase domain-containing protein [Maribrevibacterium harenarium]TPE49823.1 DUF3393 domain-containing protein [Maribrevibacterium harenarium]